MSDTPPTPIAEALAVLTREAQRWESLSRQGWYERDAGLKQIDLLERELAAMTAAKNKAVEALKRTLEEAISHAGLLDPESIDEEFETEIRELIEELEKVK
jgi:hypothetical protein